MANVRFYKNHLIDLASVTSATYQPKDERKQVTAMLTVGIHPLNFSGAEADEVWGLLRKVYGGTALGAESGIRVSGAGVSP